VVRAPGYRSRGPGSILGATRFSEKEYIEEEFNRLIGSRKPPPSGLQLSAPTTTLPPAPLRPMGEWMHGKVFLTLVAYQWSAA
jgi:hypothetical protein